MRLLSPLLLFVATLTFIAPQLRSHEAATHMAEVATDFLGTLTEEQRAKATFEIKDPVREDWHFVPRPFEGEGVRVGIPLKELRADQKHLAYALISTGLSHRGYTTALQVMSLEYVLWELEQSPRRDTEMYYLAVYGKPGSKAWGWRVEGHHFSQHFTIFDGKVVSGTPSFFASNPGKVIQGDRAGLRVLAAEEDTARDLVKSLTEEQQAKAVFSQKPPKEILTVADSEVGPLEEQGIVATELDDTQQEQLQSLLEVYVRRLRPEIADEALAKIASEGLESVRFAWAGGLEMAEPHYYRVQGESFLLEYANTQNNAYHVHAVWRQFDQDFGRDLLKEHFEKHH